MATRPKHVSQIRGIPKGEKRQQCSCYGEGRPDQLTFAQLETARQLQPTDLAREPMTPIRSKKILIGKKAIRQFLAKEDGSPVAWQTVQRYISWSMPAVIQGRCLVRLC